MDGACWMGTKPCMCGKLLAPAGSRSGSESCLAAVGIRMLCR